jgi:hypothetical protein
MAEIDGALCGAASPKLPATCPAAASAAPLPPGSAAIWLLAFLSTIAGTADLSDFFPAAEPISQWPSFSPANAMKSGRPAIFRGLRQFLQLFPCAAPPVSAKCPSLSAEPPSDRLAVPRFIARAINLQHKLSTAFAEERKRLRTLWLLAVDSIFRV